MDNILKDLYFGRYAAFERKYEPNGDHAEAIERVVSLEEALVNRLPADLIQPFRDYANAVADLASITGEEEFEEGYRLGVRMLLSALPAEITAENVPPIPKRK